MPESLEQGISDLIGALTDPIVAFPGGWEDTIPDWLKREITLERLAQNLKATKGEAPTGTDAEACAYLYTASLTMPLDRDWTKIYLYVAGKVCSRNGKEVPSDIKVESLDGYQLEELNRLKDWIYKKRIETRQERDRTERKAKREEAVKRQGTQAEFEF